MMTTLIICGVAIVGVLAAYAGYLHWRLYQQRKRQLSQQIVNVHDSDVSPGNHRVELRKSLYLLADAMLDDKMTATEGCLRICAVASNLEDSETFRQEYGVMFRVAEATAHIPILEDWKALSRDDQRRFTRERQNIEQKYADATREAAKRLREHFA